MTAGSHLEDLDLDGERVRAWLACAHFTVSGRPAGAGWSGCTVFVEADRRQLVLRLDPTQPGMFDESDLSLQVRCLRHAGANGLPVPEVVAADLTGEFLGRPGYAMTRVAGEVPRDDNPPFTESGFLTTASDAERHRYHADLVDRVADVHLVPSPTGLPLGPGTADHLDWCLRQRAGTPPTELFDRAHDLLGEALPPDPEHPTLLWGDARPANTIVGDDFRVAALLDWELAGTGHPEFDVSWLLEMNWMRARTDPTMPGWLTERQVWQRWSERTGRTPRWVDWFRLFSAYRLAVALDLHLAERVRAGALPRDHPVRTDNRARRRVRELISSFRD